MIICVASGKGGTGKTTVAANLAYANSTDLIDCDIEEPNTQLYFPMKNPVSQDVLAEYPSIDSSLCDSCKKCSEFCAFHALLIAKNAKIVMKELCHSCGGCKIICPNNAITYKNRCIGKIISAKTNSSQKHSYGILEIGEYSGTKIIKELKKKRNRTRHLVIDAPPGTGCNPTESMKGSDFIVVVTEPTLFGLHDLKLAIALVRKLDIPFGVFLNKSNEQDGIITDFLHENHIELIGKLKYSKEYAEAGANASILSERFAEIYQMFSGLLDDIANRTFK